MKILLVGSGGREHALADALSRENVRVELVAAPGNPGVASHARLVDIAVADIAGITALAEREAVDLVIVGPEAPLGAGLIDSLLHRGISSFGPTMAAASVETSKAATKQLMMSAGVPTASAEVHKFATTAREAIRTRFSMPVVIKASGLAAGKGVFVCHSLAEADQAIEDILNTRTFGDAGNECLVEEFMTGEELSLFAMTDGEDVLCMLPAQDHKRLGEMDTGPNTGGMGAYAPVSLGTPQLIDDVTDRILLPTLHALRKRQSPFSGLLYAGLMLTPDGPKVVEYNCRFGDPETQAILPLLESSLLEPMLAIARGGRLREVGPFQWKSLSAVTTVVSAPGYPESPRTGVPLELPDSTESLRVYHAGTSRANNGTLMTNGGRVAAITAIGATFAEAQVASQSGASRVEFEGAYFRRDIGWREVARQQ